ncbi:unnamed protein product [Moneuplotes crassus]|uniref:Uncharacterized protein n=1 Tax=Euplotes crassus TaxID=5936 RepID=A0AAD1XZQ0_EUPCR|nr:unnamed protein product [Moneuplotes crassus]
MLRYQDKEAVTTTIFHYINLTLLIIDSAALIGLVIAFPDAQQVLGMLALIHAFFLVPSMLYHIVPAIRTNFLFTWIAHVLSSLTLGIFVISLVLYLFVIDNQRGSDAMMAIMVGITGPGALIAGTLLMMLNSEAQMKQITYVVFPKEGSHQQPIMMI